jgi:hypothetical protein
MKSLLLLLLAVLTFSVTACTSAPKKKDGCGTDSCCAPGAKAHKH